MTLHVKINEDIFTALHHDEHDETFSVVDIKNRIQKNSDQYANNNAALLFVARSLKRLQLLSLLHVKGESQRKKRFSKATVFNFMPFEVVAEHIITDTELEVQKVQLEVSRKELKRTRDEINAYQDIMQRFDAIAPLIQADYQAALKKLKKLVAQAQIEETNADTLH